MTNLKQKAALLTVKIKAEVVFKATGVNFGLTIVMVEFILYCGSMALEFKKKKWDGPDGVHDE